VDVRRLSIGALDQVAALVADRINIPNPSPPYPPTTRQLTAEEIARINRDRAFYENEEKYFRPILDAFDKPETAKPITRTSLDPDLAVRVQARRVLEQVALAEHKVQAMLRAVPKLGAPPMEHGGNVAPAGPGVRLLSLPEGRPEALPVLADPPGEPVRPPTPAKPLDALILGLRDPAVAGRLVALNALEAMGEDAAPAIPALAQSLRDRDPFVRWSASRILKKLAPRQPEVVVPALTAGLGEPDLDVRIAFLTALERYGSASKSAVPILARMVSRGDPESRIAVLRTLDGIGPDAEPALPAIAAALADEDSRVVMAAAEVIGHFGTKAAAYEQDLIRAFRASGPSPEDNQDVRAVKARVRQAASEALLKVLGK
jgi:HEAT repeat protein